VSEPTTALATAGAVGYIGKDLALKVLGPSCEYLGDQLKLFTQKNVENLKCIFEKAATKLPDENINQGSVSAQIIKDVLFDGSFCEDEISQEYYAGVLASSKTLNSIDNRGKTISSTIRDLSAFQLTTHYILYGIAWENSSDNDYGPYFINNSALLGYFDFPSYQIPDDIKAEAQALLEHVYHGLEKHNLLKGLDDMNRRAGLSDMGQYHYQLTPGGIELFLWATGNGRKPLSYFHSKECLIYDSLDIDFHGFT
jgi:hypothetical protein